MQNRLSVTKIEQIYRFPSIVWISLNRSKRALLIVFTTNNWFFIYLLIQRILGSLKWNCSILVTLKSIRGRIKERSSVYKFISSKRKPAGISIEKQVTRSSKGLADSGVLYVLENVWDYLGVNWFGVKGLQEILFGKKSNCILWIRRNDKLCSPLHVTLSRRIPGIHTSWFLSQQNQNWSISSKSVQLHQDRKEPCCHFAMKEKGTECP